MQSIYDQKYIDEFEVIVIDSGSNDNTIRIAEKYSAKIIRIKPEYFGHGKTRNFAAKLAKGKYLVFTTQDAIPATDDWLSHLISAFDDPDIVGVYGRQIPKKDTKPMERFFLGVRYPTDKKVKQITRGATDVDTIFFSNVNSAILREIWIQQPYSSEMIVSEDIEWAKRMLCKGYKIAYEPRAAVYHSHDLNLKMVFKKYFDCGVSFSSFATKEFAIKDFATEGLSYVWQEFRYLMFNGYIRWLPYALFYNFTKFLGISIGKQEKHLPLFIKKRFSMNKYHWYSAADK